MSGNTRRNTGRFSSVARSSNRPALNEAFSCNILRELDQSIKSSYNKAWTDLDGLKKNGAELLKQLKYEDRDIPRIRGKTTEIRELVEQGIQHAECGDAGLHPYVLQRI